MVYSNDFNVLDLVKFTVILYDRYSSESSVGAVIRTLFTQKNRLYDATTPICAALFQHVLSAYQAENIWRQSLIAHATVPNPNKLGWKE